MLGLNDLPELNGGDLDQLDLLTPRQAAFSMPANRMHLVKRSKERDKKSRRGLKKLIQPENALPIVGALPTTPDERLHCILRGDFVLCDLIPLIVQARGRCPHLRLATLGLSTSNAECIRGLQMKGLVGDVTLIASHYFEQVDKNTTFRRVMTILGEGAKVVITRSHAKVFLIPTEQGDWFTIEGSANLRSSDNLEQIVIFNDQETHDMHVDWMEALAK